jgi:serine/threonine-protein kinase
VHHSAVNKAGSSTHRASQHLSQSTTSFDSIDNARFVPGTILAERYRIVSLLGRGGMGEVYRAEDLTLGQPVALKFLPENLASDGVALARFHREVRIARQISHRNVCRVYDIGQVDGQQFLSMEFIKGEELASTLKRFGRLPMDKAIEIARQICAGLAAAHDNGVLHRDLKPANVMIDENGNARITDFGLAGLAEDFSEVKLIEGTPGYMSPEQLEGQELTTRSDIYSLGLVLYEIFTGKKAFEARTLPELLQLRKSNTTPTSLSALNKDIDPLVERVILRCLEREPDERPASAIQVAAALPGGDPLQAALAAGETPSPEMVAAAPKEGVLRPAVAVALLACVLVGLVLVVLLSGKVMLHRQVQLEKSPDVLKDRASDLIKKLGYTDAPSDRAYGFLRNDEYLRYVQDHDSSPTRWDKLKSGQPSALNFWYRQSPRYLEPAFGTSIRVSPGDPPVQVSGMVNVILNPAGQLLSFTAVPPQVDEGQGQPQPPDWSILFTEAGFDIKSFKETAPKWLPLLNSDTRAAWEGNYPGQTEIPIRIEAASFRGKPIFFSIIGPWTRPSRMQADHSSARDQASQYISLVLLLTVIIAGVLLARHNLRLGRGDRKGAFRLALVVFAAFMLAWLFRASHVPTQGEFNLFIKITELALFVSGLVWLCYISLEPYVRRRWPQRIISWSRLLVGGWHDPLVGRDVLIGALFGTGMALLVYLSYLAPRWLGRPPDLPPTPALETLLGMQDVFGAFFWSHLTVVIFLGLIALFIFLLLNIILRREWLAIGLGWFLITLVTVLQGHNLAVDLIFGGLVAALLVGALVRFGLLAMIAALFFYTLCFIYPLTSNFSAWSSGGAIFALLMATALAVYGFYASLAGQPLFRGQFLQD